MTLTRYALDRGIANVADRTLADWIVIVNVAQRAPAAGITDHARIHAERIYALLVARALAARVALRSDSRQRRNWHWNKNCARQVPARKTNDSLQKTL